MAISETTLNKEFSMPIPNLGVPNKIEEAHLDPNLDFNKIMKNKEAYFTSQQVQEILDYFYHRQEWMEFHLFLTLYRTGRRITELLGKGKLSPQTKRRMGNYKGLRPIDFHDKIRSIEFDILKKGHVKKRMKSGNLRSQEAMVSLRLKKKPKRELIPVPKDLYHYLKAYIENNKIKDYDRLFPINRNCARNRLVAACRNIGMKINLGTRKMRTWRTKELLTLRVKPHMHMFRHSYAIHTLLNNKDNPNALPMLTELLQHSNPKMTMEYLKFSPQEKIRFLDKTWGVEDEEEK